jgi:hypothetical protein
VGVRNAWNDEFDSVGVGIEGEPIWKGLLGEVMTALWQGQMTTVVRKGDAGFAALSDRDDR